MARLTLKTFPKLVDHTLLKPTASMRDIEKLCQEAIENEFFAICVNPCHVAFARETLRQSPVRLATVTNFPLGSSTLKTSLKECEESLALGADEVDMVMPIGALKDGRYKEVETYISQLKDVCDKKILKVILEVCLLTSDEIKTATELSKSAGADFVKTSTGFSTGGATVEAVELMRKTFGEEGGVKASGGIRTLEDAQAMVDAGATRLGLSSSLMIMEELRNARD